MTWPFAPLPMFAFDVIMVDPPWPWKAWSELGYEKSPEAQYQTMSMGDIASLPVGDLVGAGGLIWLWCTWPLVDEQAAVMRRWGFVPLTGGAWAKRTASGKLRWGTGHILRSVCEPFLIGGLGGRTLRSGKFPNLVETLCDAVIDGLAREHSRKPDESFSLIEALTPGARRAEIFSRQTRPGWASWGNETGKFAGSSGFGRSQEHAEEGHV